MSATTLPVVLTPGEDGFVVAECPLVPGCVSQGRDRDEALANIREAIELCLEARAAGYEGNAWSLPGFYEVVDVELRRAEGDADLAAGEAEVRARVAVDLLVREGAGASDPVARLLRDRAGGELPELGAQEGVIDLGTDHASMMRDAES